jgi:hypothetical protein
MHRHFTRSERAAAQRVLDELVRDARTHALDNCTRDPEAVIMEVGHYIHVRAVDAVLKAVADCEPEPGVRTVRMLSWPAKVGA